MRYRMKPSPWLNVKKTLPPYTGKFCALYEQLSKNVVHCTVYRDNYDVVIRCFYDFDQNQISSVPEEGVLTLSPMALLPPP